MFFPTIHPLARQRSPTEEQQHLWRSPKIWPFC